MLVIAAIFVIFFQPVMILRFTNTLYSSVVVLVDDSLSMSFPDKYLSPSRRSDESDDEYRKRTEAAAEARKALAEQLGVEIGELRSMSRSDIVRRLLVKRGGPLGKLARDHPLVIMRFSTADQTKPYTQKLLDAPVQDPDGESTDEVEGVEVVIDPAAVREAFVLLARSSSPATSPATVPADEGDDPVARFDKIPERNVDARLSTLVALAGGTEKLIEKLAKIEDRADIAALGDAVGKLRQGGVLGRRLALAELKGRGFETNLSTAIRDALEKVSGRRLAGIIVISDGQITSSSGGGNGRLSSALEFARQSQVPLYGVSVGDPEPPKNLTVAALQAPREVRKDSEAEFSATITHRNLDGQTVNVRLQERPVGETDWRGTGINKDVVLGGAGRSEGDVSRTLHTVSMVYTPTKVGDFEYRAVVDPIAGEEKKKDNHAASIVTVSENRIRILVISGDAGWEFQYMRNFLLRQPDLYRISIWQQNADPNVNQAASTGMKLTQLPRTMQELAGVRGDKTKPGYNVVVLYDPQHTKGGFDKIFVDLLWEFVEEHNGGLCYIAGNKHSDSSVAGKGALAPLADVIPVVLADNTINIADRIRQDKPSAWPVRLTSYGLEHPVTRLGGSDEDTKKIWQILPGQYWSHPVFKVKPGARVLAVSSNPMRRTANGDRQPLVVAQSVGAGRSLYIGIEASWRWRYVHDGYYHRRFWARAMRYLASMRTRRIVISTGGNQFAAGEKITIEVKASNKEYKALTDKAFTIEMINSATGKSEAIELPAVDVEKKPGRYKRTIVARRTGTFELTALRSGTDSPDDVTSKKIVVELPKAEARRPEADPETLRAVASREDRFMAIHEVDRLAELIPQGRLKTTRQQVHKLWDCPMTLIAIVLLLAIEWIVRKKYNMA